MTFLKPTMMVLVGVTSQIRGQPTKSCTQVIIGPLGSEMPKSMFTTVIVVKEWGRP